MTSRSTMALFTLTSASLVATAAVAQSAAGGQRSFTTALTGAAEVPGPGHSDGTGSATVTVSVPKKQVCYEIDVSGIGTPTAAHIHEGAAGDAGPAVVTLETPDTGSSNGCENVTAKVVAQILAQPSQYYVNVHTGDFPAGAVRGQLK